MSILATSTTMAPPETQTVEPQYNFITKDELAERVKGGEILVIYNEKVYNLTKWINHHPGGVFAVRQMNGRDATDEINLMHPPEVYTKRIHSFYEGELAPDQGLTSITKKQAKSDAAAKDLKPQKEFPKYDNEKIRRSFQKLEAEVEAAGLFKCNYWNYARESCRYVTFFTLAIYLTVWGTELWQHMAGAVFLAMFWHQIMFTAHDAGHNGITHIRKVDALIGAFLGDFMGGLSIGWWKKSHYVHHIVPNDVENDPDVQHLPFFALSTRFFDNIYSSYFERIMHFNSASKCFVRIQHISYYIIMLFARFNLYNLSFQFLYLHPKAQYRNIEFAGMAFFFTWYPFLVSFLPDWQTRLAFVLVSNGLTAPLHIQITLSHFGMSMEDMGPDEPFVVRQLRTTMDVDCPEWMDFIHGGLQFQVIHHLFPRVPRHNLRKCQPYVKKFCAEHGFTYHIYTFTKGNWIVLKALKDVADQVVFFDKVAQYNAANMAAGHYH
ncbi:delta-6 fatty acid desaturase [Jimgerdemannia flammicorona]|uniref:Delta-6 fatty acid desaturase n=1 Tax=Jimgerdemannia flammicorona TaxID=994334 RepID=A0A433QHN8_9FUNG|nr:delta-6 fatty acid desaturase [Jimgerdemannia flammicorona]